MRSERRWQRQESGRSALRQAQGKRIRGSEGGKGKSGGEGNSDSTGVLSLPKQGGQDDGFWKEMAETGYFDIKRPAKDGSHIIIQDEPMAAMAALGAAGVIWELKHANDNGHGPAFGWAQASGNPYLVDLPEMVERIKAGDGVSGKGKEQEKMGKGVSVMGKVKDNIQNESQLKTRNQGLETLKTQFSGIISREPDTLTGKVVKEGAKLAVKGIKQIWKMGKKRFLK